ncbi:DUF58 domain-containing protein [Catenuloplanes atrovinosus]|uniref:Uncharacterized protein (DUF58 family) n=1 Tax=Catenuloplanes atrovinosus TaxID=137266 RepID=A0AAE4CAQ6_9ACTN|nr:DUF58 domain-containing protein [Catenuloplanes atrovinosus]MDR7277826.1 uncharacterized protein (DUF58 family) [Catenuloplanes atrovinosus]
MRPTLRGLGLAGGAAVLLAAGLRFGYPELAVLGAAGLLAVLWAVLFVAWRPRLSLSRVADPDRVPRGEPSTMILTLRNAARRRSATLTAADSCGGRPVPVPPLRLRAGRDTTVTYPVPTHRRGRIPVGPLRVTREDPLGLVRLAQAHGEPVTVWVHPRILPLSAVPAGVTRSLDGRSDRVPQGSITFDTLREYVIGDDLRRVHWRSTAKMGELMVREQLDTSLPRLVVLLDDRAGSHTPLADGQSASFEAACEAAASIVAAAAREDLPVTMHLVSGAEEPGRPHLDTLTAAELHRADAGTFQTATTRLRQQRFGDTLIFVTGPGGRDDLGQLGTVRQAYPVLVAVLLGVAGEGPSGQGAGMLVINAEDGDAFAAEWNGASGW